MTISFRSLVAWFITAVGVTLIYLFVAQLVALLITPTSRYRTLTLYIVEQFGLFLGLFLIILGQWIRGRQPRIKVRKIWIRLIRKLQASLRLGKVALLIAIITIYQIPIGADVGSIVPVFAWMGRIHIEEITDPAIDLVISNQTGRQVSEELKLFREVIKKAVGEEDAAPRDFNHFYTPPDKGLEWKWYYPLRSAIDGALVSEPASGRFPDAYHWARAGAGTGDPYNWLYALSAYDYTPESKNRAYERLGHVIHLLEDMSEPDHARGKPHPGSSLLNTEIAPLQGALVGLIVGFFGGGPVVGLLGAIIGASIAYLFASMDVRWGYERLIEEKKYHPHIDPIPKTPEYHASLKAYFDIMAYETISEASAYSLSGVRIDPAVGVDDLYIPPLTINLLLTEIEITPEIRIPIMPIIDPDNAQLYHDLANKLGSLAIRRAAGLMMWFYDIVNFPPYVTAVAIKQGGVTKYAAKWEDNEKFSNDIGANRTISRWLNVSINEPLDSGKIAEIFVLFGPKAGNDLFNLPIYEKVDRVLVKVDGEVAQGTLVRDGLWVGNFTPYQKGCKQEQLEVEIIAMDCDLHHRVGYDDDKGLRSPDGDLLDSDPATPAKLSRDDRGLPFPPYYWNDYTPGPDTNHKVLVKPDFEFANITPKDASVIAGGSVDFTITLSNGPTEVKLKALDLPLDSTAFFNPNPFPVPSAPNTASSTLKISTSESTPMGAYKVKIIDELSAPSSGVLVGYPECYAEVTLIVQPHLTTGKPPEVGPAGEGDFSITVNPSSDMASAGFVTGTQVMVSIIGGYDKTVTLSYLAPSGFTASFAQYSGKPTFTTMMLVDVPSTAKVGAYPITIVGTGTDGKTHSTTFTVIVTTVATPPPEFDYHIGGPVKTQSVSPGQSATYPITVTLISGSTQPVSLDLRGLPQGASFSFSPNIGNPTFISRLLITTPEPTSRARSILPGTYTLTIIASGGGVVKTTTVTLVVVQRSIR